MTRYTRHGDFPRVPEECKRHRAVPIRDLSTGKAIEPRRYVCWRCGLDLGPDGAS